MKEEKKGFAGRIFYQNGKFYGKGIHEELTLTEVGKYLEGLQILVDALEANYQISKVANILCSILIIVLLLAVFVG